MFSDKSSFTGLFRCGIFIPRTLIFFVSTVPGLDFFMVTGAAHTSSSAAVSISPAAPMPQSRYNIFMRLPPYGDQLSGTSSFYKILQELSRNFNGDSSYAAKIMGGAFSFPAFLR